MPLILAAHGEEWSEMSRSDDATVADTLLRLRHAVPPPRPSSALRLVWTTRQRRSGSRKDDSEPKKREEGVESTRASPSTPLSFSAATSCSGGAAEESSRSKISTLKVRGNRMKKTINKVKKKKTLVELKVEEDELLMEKTSLKNELAKLRLKFEKARVKNEILKRKKLDLLMDSEVRNDEVMMKVEKFETVFELPDLNLPFEQQQHYGFAEDEESNIQGE